MKLGVFVGAVLFVTASATAELVTYPEYPDAIERDWAYDVSVTQGGESRKLVVYNHCEKSALTTRTRGGDVNRRFCEFAFSGAQVRVDIRVCEDVKSYKVFPSRLNLQSSFSNGVISVWLDEPHSFGIELNDYVKTILSVLVEAPEDPANIPSRNDPKVMYIDGWMDAPGSNGVLSISNQCSEVYIAPGAVLNARLSIGKQGAYVHGRGMILDPFSDIFRYDQMNNTNAGVVVTKNTGVRVEDVKIVDARTFNYITYYNSTTFRNIKAFSSMMCSDGMTCGGRGFVMEGAWLYVGDNALVVGGIRDHATFSNIVIGTSCSAVFPQDNNVGVRMENIDVFRADEGLVSNYYNPGTNQTEQSFFFKNLSAVDSTLFSRFFTGGNTGTRLKTFGYENVAIPASTGSDDWHTIGSSGGKTIKIYDSSGKPFTTCNYSLFITNLWVAGARSDGFAESEFTYPEGATVTVVNNRMTSAIPAVPNRHVVNWTCPWKRYIGHSLQRDTRYATPDAGEQRLVEPDMYANLLADRPAMRSAWQRNPSWQAKLDATQVEDGARVYRLRKCEVDSGMYNDITDAFLRRGNGVYRLSFEARVPEGANVPARAVLLSNEKSITESFEVPGDGRWHRYSFRITTGFDPAVAELVGLAFKSSASSTLGELDFRNLSFAKVEEKVDPASFERSFDISFPGYTGSSTLEDFPVLVRVSPSRCGFQYDRCKVANGGDLRFTDDCGRLLVSEIDTWNTNGESLVWVKVPYMGSNAVIRAYYGCANPPAVDPTEVWANGYVGVWHLGDGAAMQHESSGKSSDLKSSGSGIDLAASGIAGGAVDFREKLKGRMLVALDHDNLDGFVQCTLEAWTFQTNTAVNSGILSKRSAFKNDVSYQIYDNGSSSPNVVMVLGTNDTSDLVATVDGGVSLKPVLSTWNHLAYVFDAGRVKGYTNGAISGSAQCNASRIISGPADLCVGNFDKEDTRNFPGKIDEVRISKVARSADWIKATHDMMANADFAVCLASDAYSECEFAREFEVSFPYAASVGAVLTNFPVLVRLSSSISGFSYADFSRPHGGDLRFFDENGVIVPHEVDTWDETGTSLVWVRLPRLATGAKLKGRYGCVGDLPVVDAKDVWGEDYVGVWHLGESALPMKESSRNATDFTSSNGEGIGYASSGVVGGAVDFGDAEQSRRLIAQDHFNLDGFEKFTLEAWTRLDSRYRKNGNESKGLLSKRNGAYTQISYFMFDNYTGKRTKFVVSTNGTGRIEMPGDVNVSAPTDAWAHQAFTFDAGSISGYLDGTSKGSTTVAAQKINASKSPLYLGNFDGTDVRNFPGIVDEVRISKVARSPQWLKATYMTVGNGGFSSCSKVTRKEVRNPVLTIVVNAGATNTLNASDVMPWTEKIVKKGAGTLVASPIPDYAGDFEIEAGLYSFSNAGDFGKTGVGVIDVKDGASLEFRGGANNVLSGKTLNLYGAKASTANGKIEFLNSPSRSLGSNIAINLKDSSEVFYLAREYVYVGSGTIDLGGHELRIKGTGNWRRFEIGATIKNGGSLVYEKSQFHVSGSRKPVFSSGVGTATLKFVNDAEMNWKEPVPSNGWTLYCDASTVRGNLVRFPDTTDYPAWDGPIAFTNSSKVANWTGGYTVSNTVFNLKGAISGSGTLAVGPGWLNLHSADNAYSGAVTVNGQSLASDNPILPGSGGIGLCNGATCFLDAKSVTFNNSSRLAFMDDSACTVGTNVVFAGGAGDLQSISGGVHTTRSTIAGFRKTGAGTLLVDSPVSVTGTAYIQAGTLKLANRANVQGQANEEVLAPMPVFSSLAFGSGTTLDLSDTVGYQVADIAGSPVVTNAGLFCLTGKWTLTSPGEVLTVTGDDPQLVARNAAGFSHLRRARRSSSRTPRSRWRSRTQWSQRDRPDLSSRGRVAS